MTTFSVLDDVVLHVEVLSVLDVGDEDEVKDEVLDLKDDVLDVVLDIEDDVVNVEYDVYLRNWW